MEKTKENIKVIKMNIQTNDSKKRIEDKPFKSNTIENIMNTENKLNLDEQNKSVKEKSTVQFSLWIDKELLKKVRLLAIEDNTSVKEIVNDAIMMYLK